MCSAVVATSTERVGPPQRSQAARSTPLGRPSSGSAGGWRAGSRPHHLGLERAAESLEQLGDANRDPSGELRDFVVRGLGQRVEDERPVVALANVHVVHREAV